MKLNFGSLKRSQPDPFIFEDDGKYYLYVTAGKGTEAYSADDPFGNGSSKARSSPLLPITITGHPV